jgi:hypothetical protein
VRLEGLGKLKKSNDLIGTRTRYLPTCSIVPQPTTLPRAAFIIIIIIIIIITVITNINQHQSLLSRSLTHTMKVTLLPFLKILNWELQYELIITIIGDNQVVVIKLP